MMSSAPPNTPSGGGTGTHLERTRRLERIRGLGHVLDTSIRIPGTSIRFGLDPVIGLIPGLGDALGTALSGYIIIEATRFGASKSVLVRMLGNVGLEALVGLIPGVGDIFDALWKSNTRNVKLLERHLERPDHTRRQSQRYLALVVGGLALLVAVSLAGMAWALVLLFRLVGG